MTSAELDARIALAAERAHVYAIHWPDSTRVTAKGWPDWSFIGPRGVMFRECKTGGARCSPEQRAVGYALQGNGLDWALWRPDDWHTGLIEREITALAVPMGRDA